MIGSNCSAGDGQMRVWRIGAHGTLLCTLPAAQGRMECVNCICKDKAQTKVFVGDTGGHIRIWDISKGIDASSQAASAASFKQVGRLSMCPVDWLLGWPRRRGLQICQQLRPSMSRRDELCAGSGKTPVKDCCCQR